MISARLASSSSSVRRYSSASLASTRAPSSVSSMFRDVPSTIGVALASPLATAWEPTVVPMPQWPSMYMATVVAERRSSLTPEELSPSNNMRSPTSEAIDTITSASNSVRHWVNCSSNGMDATMPR